MKKNRHIILAIALAATMFSCENDTRQNTPTDVNKNDFLLKSITWKDTDATAYFSYNTDNTIKKIDYSGSHSSYGLAFFYQQKKIKEINTAGMSKNIFTYDTFGRIETMTKYIKESTERPTERLEFTYDQYNHVSMLKYFDINEAGSKLIYTNTYEFDQMRRPSKITAVDKNGNKIITTILGYSPDISFDPLYFSGADIGENYGLYNYPVLSSLGQLPTDIRLSSIINGQTKVDREIHVTYSLTGRRIDKQVNSQHYPMHPNLDQQVQIDYTY